MSAGAHDVCCRDVDLEHCHAPYVEHVDGGECADPGCRLSAEAHPDVVVCSGTAPVCTCGGGAG